MSTDELPALRFEDGDLLLKLGPSSKDWLLVHKSVLGAGIPYVSAALKDRWNQSGGGTTLRPQEKGNTSTLSLKFVDSTFVLSENQEFVGQTAGEKAQMSRRGWAFHFSQLTEMMWPDIHYAAPIFDVPAKDIPSSTLAHKTIIALLYGYNLTFGAICPITKHRADEKDPWYQAQDLHYCLNYVSMACAYASYYGCLPTIAEKMSQLLLSHPLIWEAVAQEPEYYVIMGSNLRCSELYFESLRHLYSRCNLRDLSSFYSLAKLWDVSAEEAMEIAGPEIRAREAVAERLETDLMKVQLSESEAYYAGLTKPVATTFMNMLKFKRKKGNDEAKAREAAAYLARSIYGEWLIQQLHGARVYWDGRRQRSKAGGTLANAIFLLRDAAKAEQPSDLFGSGTVKTMLKYFDVKKASNPETLVKEALDRIVQNAVDVISREMIEGQWGYSGLARDTRNRMNRKHFSWMVVDEDAVPWEDETAWEEAAAPPTFDLRPASETRLRAVGIDIEGPVEEETLWFNGLEPMM